MLDPWIKIFDILALFNQVKQTDGLVNRRDFQKALLTCKAYKSPRIKKIKSHKPKSYKVKNVHEIIGNINTYKRNFKGGVFLDNLRWMQQNGGSNSLNDLDLNAGEIHIHLYWTTDNNNYIELEERDTIFGNKALAKALKVSNATISRWRGNGIIKTFDGDYFEIVMNGIKYKGEYPFCYYSLKDIKKEIGKHR